MDLQIIPDRDNQQRRMVCSSHPGLNGEPVLFYEIVEQPGVFSVEATALRRVVRPVVSRARSRSRSESREAREFVVRWGILKASTLEFLGGKERLPELLKRYLRKTDRANNGRWTREFTGEDKQTYRWKLENNTELRLYRADDKLVASYHRAEKAAGQIHERTPILHIKERGMPILDQILLTWIVVEPMSSGKGSSLVQTLRRV